MEELLAQVYDDLKHPYLKDKLPFKNTFKSQFGSSPSTFKPDFFANDVEFENIMLLSWTRNGFLYRRYLELRAILSDMLQLIEEEI